MKIPAQTPFVFQPEPFYNSTYEKNFPNRESLEPHFHAVSAEHKALSAILDTAYKATHDNEIYERYHEGEYTPTIDRETYERLHARNLLLRRYQGYLLLVGEIKFNYLLFQKKEKYSQEQLKSFGRGW